MQRSLKRLGVILLPVLITVTGCAGGSAPPSGPSLKGQVVRVLAVYSGSEAASFREMVAPFEAQTGAKVELEGTRDIETVLSTRVQAGNPPELAFDPDPAALLKFGQQGKVVALDSGVISDSDLKQRYGDAWIKLGSAGGHVYGIMFAVNLRGLIWRDPAAMTSAGFSNDAPKTWNDLQQLSTRIISSGKTPWCMGTESGPASGWPAADWVEDILLRQSGPDTFAQWYQGKLKWTSPEVKQAWQTWGTMLSTQGMFHGGSNYSLATSFGDSGNLLFKNPPGCYLLHQASFMPSFFTKAAPDAKAQTDYDAWPFPNINPAYSDSAIVGGDIVGMFHDTPAARKLINYISTAAAQSIWAKRGSFISANKQVSLDSYPDALSKAQAQILSHAKFTVFQGAALMPLNMTFAFFKATQEYIKDPSPSKLDRLLAGLDQTQADAYK